MREVLRVGVIGAGVMGLHHSRSLARLVEGAELAAVADADLGAARRAAALAPGVSVAADYRELLADSSIRAVVITTPSDAHATLIQAAAAAGKHIFCEKPIALDLADADAALSSVRENGVKLQIGFQRRFDPGFREARRGVASGELGSVELIVATTRDPEPPSVEYLEHSGDLFTDTAIHDLDAVRFLSGQEVIEVFATGSSMFLKGQGGEGVVDTAVTTLRLETGALAVITNSRRATYGYEVGCEVLGSSGKIAIGREQRTSARRYSAQGVSHDYVRTFQERFAEAYVEELAQFVECITQDREPEATGKDGRAALALAVAAARSLRAGHPVSLTD